MSRFRLIRSVSAVALASVALTACAGTVREDTSSTPAEASSSVSAIADVEPTPSTEPEATAEDDGVQITGDYQADLAAVGFEPADDEFEHVMRLHEKWYCEEPIDLDAMFSSYESTIRDSAENPSAGPDMIRVVVNYECPTRILAVENILEDL